MTTNKTKVLACATVNEEMLTMMPGWTAPSSTHSTGKMIRIIPATELTLGRDRFAQKYSKAYQAGMFG